MSQSQPTGFTRQYLTIEETADVLRMSRWKVFDLLRQRELSSFKPGRQRLIPASEIEAFVSRQLEEEAA